MASGKPCATYTSTSAVRVFTRFSSTISWRMDTVPKRMGTMMPKAKKNFSQRLPLKRYSDKPQAAMAPNSRMKNSDAIVTIKLLPKYMSTSERPSTLV